MKGLLTVEDNSTFRVHGKVVQVRRVYSYWSETEARAFMERVGARAAEDDGAIEVVLTLRRDGEPLDEWNVSLRETTEIEPLPEPRYNDDV